MRDYYKLWRKFKRYIQDHCSKIENHIKGLEEIGDKSEIDRYEDILEEHHMLLRQMDWIEIQ